MVDFQKEDRDKIRRTISHEFVRMEDDYDETRLIRSKLIAKLATAAENVKLLNSNNEVMEETDTGLRLFTTTLKALSDMEKASASAIMLKLKQSEQEIASSAAAKDRIAIILKATAPGKIEGPYPSDELESQLEEMFGKDIQDFELKTSPRDLSSD